MKGTNKQYSQQQNQAQQQIQPEEQQLNYQQQDLMYLTFQKQQPLDQQQNFHQLQEEEDEEQQQAQEQLQFQQQQEGINLYKDSSNEDAEHDDNQRQEEQNDDSENEVNQKTYKQQYQGQQKPSERGNSDERMRLSKMSAEQAEMEYQNRCQQQLQLLMAKSNSLKKTQSNSNGSMSNRSNTNKNNNENHNQVPFIDKKQDNSQKKIHDNNKSQPQGINVNAQNGQVQQQQIYSKQYSPQNGLNTMNNPNQKHIIISENKENQRITSANSKQQQQSQQNQHAIIIKSNNLHPQRPSSCDRLSQMYEYQIHMRRQKEEVAANIRQLQEQRAVAMCTFTPKLTKKASALSLRNHNYLPIEDKTTIFMMRKQVLVEKNQEEKRRQELISCPFSPSLNPRKISSSVDRPEEQLSVYDRQIEWQKKVQEKNHQRMISREASVMTPSVRSGSAKKQQKCSTNEGYNNNSSSLSCAPHQSPQGDQILNYRGGYFQKERVSNTFITYLTCKYQQFQAQDTASHQSEHQPVLYPSSAQRNRKNHMYDDYNQSDNNNNNNVPQYEEHPQTLAVKPIQLENETNQKLQKDRTQGMNENNQNNNNNKYIQQQQQQYSYLVKQLQQQSSMKPTSSSNKFSILKKQESTRMLKNNDSKLHQNQSSQSCSQIGQANARLLPCKAPSFSGVCRSNNIIVEKNKYILADREEEECEMFDQAKKNLAEYISAKIQQREGITHGQQNNKRFGNK